MENKRIVIVGDSPATYICGIYLHTANISPIIIRKDMKLDYLCSFVPGVEAGKEEYNQKCHDQAKNMGIAIYESSDIEITEKHERYIVKYGNSLIEADIVVSDTSLGLKSSESLFIIEDLLLEKEAIVVAGTGCTVAFEIKELLQ